MSRLPSLFQFSQSLIATGEFLSDLLHFNISFNSPRVLLQPAKSVSRPHPRTPRFNSPRVLLQQGGFFLAFPCRAMLIPGFYKFFCGGVLREPSKGRISRHQKARLNGQNPPLGLFPQCTPMSMRFPKGEKGPKQTKTAFKPFKLKKLQFPSGGRDSGPSPPSTQDSEKNSLQNAQKSVTKC